MIADLKDIRLGGGSIKSVYLNNNKIWPEEQIIPPTPPHEKVTILNVSVPKVYSSSIERSGRLYLDNGDNIGVNVTGDSFTLIRDFGTRASHWETRDWSDPDVYYDNPIVISRSVSNTLTGYNDLGDELVTVICHS